MKPLGSSLVTSQDSCEQHGGATGRSPPRNTRPHSDRHRNNCETIVDGNSGSASEVVIFV